MRQREWPPSRQGEKSPRAHALYLLSTYGYSRSQAYDIVRRLQEPYAMAQLPEQELVRLLMPPQESRFRGNRSVAAIKHEAVRITSTDPREIEDPLLPNKAMAYAERRRVEYPRALGDLMRTKTKGAARRAIQRERKRRPV